MPELLKTRKLPFYLLLDELSVLAFLFPIAFDSIFNKQEVFCGFEMEHWREMGKGSSFFENLNKPQK